MYSVRTLLKVVGYYDLSVLSMSVMGFQKKVRVGRWLGGVSLYHFFFDFWNLFNFAKPLSQDYKNNGRDIHTYGSTCMHKYIYE